MPFAAEFDAVFNSIKEISTTVFNDQKLNCKWLKDDHAAGVITDDIVGGIRNSAFCIADISGCNANVMWEAGYAMASGKPTILLSQTDALLLPFDLKTHKVIHYSINDLLSLKEILIKSIQDTLSKYPPLPTETIKNSSFDLARRICITGSQQINTNKLCSQIDNYLSPYLSKNTIWFTGTLGDSDYEIVKYLIENKQNVIGVGYNRFDASKEIGELIKEGKMRFIDSECEIIPKAMSQYGRRNSTFLLKSDMAILFWNGFSNGISLINSFFQKQGLPSFLITIQDF